MSDDDYARTIPANELDYNYMITDPAWGKEATKELDDKLSQSFIPFICLVNEKGQIITDKDKKPITLTTNKDGEIINKEGKVIVDDNNNPAVFSTRRGLWGTLAYYTRDIRLGNIKNQEMFRYCQEWLDIAGDLLKEGYVNSFMSSLSRVITVLELSQSINGFLRRQGNTITSENFNVSDDKRKENKSSFFNIKKKS